MNSSGRTLIPFPNKIPELDPTIPVPLRNNPPNLSPLSLPGEYQSATRDPQPATRIPRSAFSAPNISVREPVKWYILSKYEEDVCNSSRRLAVAVCGVQSRR